MSLFLLTFLLLYNGIQAQNYSQQTSTLYSLSVNNIDGVGINLSNYQGSKILFFIAPCKKSDSLQISLIDSFINLYGTKIKLIAVLSREDGYVDSNKAMVKALYQPLASKLVLTDGMFIRKGSGSNQSSLMHWLTDESTNKRSNKDATGVGQKFFIDEMGRFYAATIPEVPFFSIPVENNVRRKSSLN